MQQDELALSKAIESGDTDLVYLVILHIKRCQPPLDFFHIIRNKPVVLDLLILYCKQQVTVNFNRFNFNDLKIFKPLKDLYFQFEQLQETAAITVLEAYQQKVISW